jgi:hypothetical protein
MKFFNHFMVLTILSIFILSPSSVLAEDVYANVSVDFDDEFYDDATEFAYIIDAEAAGWGIKLCSHSPYSTYWEEESYNGYDNSFADDAELTLLVAHGDSSGAVTEILFGNNHGYIDNPDHVRLGYESPDSIGDNIWWVSITCQLLKDTSYSSWANCLTGTHMILSFKSNAVFTNFDLREFADRLTDGGSYPQETVKNAFYHTYVDDDHPTNIARIVYENYSVLSNDYIDSYDDETTVDSTKHTWTGY